MPCTPQVDQDGGPSDRHLRSLWRGRMGMTPEEQLHLFANPSGEAEGEDGLSEWEEPLSGQELADAEAELVQRLSEFKAEMRKHAPSGMHEREEEPGAPTPQQR